MSQDHDRFTAELWTRIASSNTTPFRRDCMRLCAFVPKGKVTTYLAISNVLHSSPRAVGGAMRNNPLCPDVPCHRVVAASLRSLGGYSGQTSLDSPELKRKIQFLQEEGVILLDDGKAGVSKDSLYQFEDLNDEYMSKLELERNVPIVESKELGQKQHAEASSSSRKRSKKSQLEGK